MDQIKQIFGSSPFDIYQIVIYLQASGDSIPADLLGSNSISSSLSIFGASTSTAWPYASLNVSSDAFRSSQYTLQYFTAYYLDTHSLDLTFLSGFQRMVKIEFNSVLNLDPSLRTLPPLPTMVSLFFSNSTGLNEVFQTVGNPLQVNGLNYLRAYTSGLDAKSLSNLLDWLAPSSIVSLQELTVSGNKIQTIPSQIVNFRNLRNINIASNKVDMTISNNSFDTPRYGHIALASSRVVEVETSAFQGYSLLFGMHSFLQSL